MQDDLRHLKEQIISQGVSTEIIDLRTLESAIERTEQSVRVSLMAAVVVVSLYFSFLIFLF